jgi:hypothetical protein
VSSTAEVLEGDPSQRPVRIMLAPAPGALPKGSPNPALIDTEAPVTDPPPESRDDRVIAFCASPDPGRLAADRITAVIRIRYLTIDLQVAGIESHH